MLLILLFVLLPPVRPEMMANSIILSTHEPGRRNRGILIGLPPKLTVTFGNWLLLP